MPVAWVGPVWAPVVVSAALVVVRLAATRRLRAGRPVVVGRVRAIGALAGGSLVIVSFLADTNRVLAGDSAAWTGWPVFWVGIALAAAATVSARREVDRARGSNARFQHGTGGRPPDGAPD